MIYSARVFDRLNRLKSGGSKNGAPFPSAVVVFRPSVRDALDDSVIGFNSV